jgi:hypothetical protein
VVAILVLIGAGAVASDASAKTRTAPETPTAHASSLTGFICNQLEGPATMGAKSLLRGMVGFDGGLATTLIVKVAFTKCESAINKVASVVKKFLGLQKHPKRKQSASPKNTYLNNLDSYSAGLIASRLRPYSSTITGSGDVFRFADALCFDARNNLDPNSTLAAFVPGAGRGALSPLNATVSLVVQRCNLTGFRRSYLALGVTSYVLDRISHRDFDPPFALVFNPAFSWNAASGTWTTSVSWIGNDATSGIGHYELWLWSRSNYSSRGRWDRISTSGNSWTGRIRRGYHIQFALRAQDRAGNWSPYSYTRGYGT